MNLPIIMGNWLSRYTWLTGVRSPDACICAGAGAYCSVVDRRGKYSITHSIMCRNNDSPGSFTVHNVMPHYSEGLGDPDDMQGLYGDDRGPLQDV